MNYYRKERTKCFLATLLDIKVALFNPLKCPLISGSGPKWTISDLMSDLLLLISLRSASAFRTGKLQLSYSSFLFYTFHYLLYESRSIMGGKSSFPPWQFHLHIGKSLSGTKKKRLCLLLVLNDYFGHLRVEITIIHWLFLGFDGKSTFNLIVRQQIKMCD